MLIKEKVHFEKSIQFLEKIAKLSDISEDTAGKIEKELKTLRAGERGESDSAYFIDFHYKENKNWAVIHDLRIEYGGNVAQIDHLLINRFLQFYVLETKSYASGIKITAQGEFLFWFKNRYLSMESPIEQNRRHVLVLEKLLKGEGLLPKRLGIELPATFKPFVLVSPKSNVIRPPEQEFNTEMVIKSDALFRQIESEFDKLGTLSIVGSLAKVISAETLYELAQHLITYHKPVEIDYAAKFAIAPVAECQPTASQSVDMREKAQEGASIHQSADTNEKVQERSPSPYFCYKCKRTISSKAAIFCFQHKARFGGKAYCFDCQKVF